MAGVERIKVNASLGSANFADYDSIGAMTKSSFQQIGEPPSAMCFLLSCRVFLCCEGACRQKNYDGKSHAMKFTAPIAMPIPKTMPASVFFD